MTSTTARGTSAPIVRDGAVRSYVRLYGTLVRTSIATNFQYRLSQYMYMVGMIIEPVIYLVVWRTIADAQGGEVAGYTAGTFAAYYIVWTLVRNINIVFTPFGWEERIREGQMSGHLVRPLHPIHYDLGIFLGMKFVVIVLWLPIAAALMLVFRPELHPDAAQIVVFSIAIWGAYLIRSLLLWVLGLITFWTTKVTAIFETYFAAELLLSGRLVPIGLMPGWARSLAGYLPFESCFGFPITALVGPIDHHDLVVGLLKQLIWIAFGVLAVSLVWRRALVRYTAVSG